MAWLFTVHCVEAGWEEGDREWRGTEEWGGGGGLVAIGSMRVSFGYGACLRVARTKPLTEAAG